MSHFAYLALDTEGRERSGLVAATDDREAAERLRGERLVVLSLRLAARTRSRNSNPWSLIASSRRPSDASLEALLRQQSVMIEAGLTLLQALETGLAPSAPRSVQRVAGRLAEAVRTGSSFSDALAAERGLLGASALERIRTAEVTGEVSAALQAIADDMERSRRVRVRFRAALTYPAVVALVAAAVTAFLVVQVVPKFAQFFARAGKPLPPSLQFLVTTSETLATVAPLAIALLLVVVLATVIARRRRAGRLAVDRFLLGLPLFGWIASRHALWAASSSLSGLLAAGIPILRSVRLSASACRNAAVADALDRAADRVLVGDDLATSLDHPLMPSDFRQVVSVGEKSGELSRVLSHLATHYEREVDAAVTRLAGLAEPVLLVTVGGLVGFVYLSFFQAIFQIAGG